METSPTHQKWKNNTITNSGNSQVAKAWSLADVSNTQILTKLLSRVQRYNVCSILNLARWAIYVECYMFWQALFNIIHGYQGIRTYQLQVRKTQYQISNVKSPRDEI